MTNTESSQPDYHAVAAERALDAYDAAVLGKSCIDDLRTILLALVKLTAPRDYAREVVHDLANVGYYMALTKGETLDAERVALSEALQALKGAKA